MSTSLEGYDWTNFWNDSEYALREYVGAPLTHEMIQAVEREYGYKLPESYIQMLRNHNGGIPNKDACPSPPTSWAEDHCGIHGIYGVDPEKPYALLGKLFRSDFWIEEWGYPDTGLYICDCPSAGHDMIALDYSKCGHAGEPRVVHIDQEYDYEITMIAESFAEFIRKLVSSEVFDDEE